MAVPTPSGKGNNTTDRTNAAGSEDSRDSAAIQYDNSTDHEGGDEASADRMVQRVFLKMAKRIANGESPDPEKPVDKSWKI